MKSNFLDDYSGVTGTLPPFPFKAMFKGKRPLMLKHNVASSRVGKGTIINVLGKDVGANGDGFTIKKQGNPLPFFIYENIFDENFVVIGRYAGQTVESFSPKGVPMKKTSNFLDDHYTSFMGSSFMGSNFMEGSAFMGGSINSNFLDDYSSIGGGKWKDKLGKVVDYVDRAANAGKELLPGTGGGTATPPVNSGGNTGGSGTPPAAPKIEINPWMIGGGVAALVLAGTASYYLFFKK